MSDTATVKPVATCSQLIAVAISAFKSLVSLLPIPDATKRGSEDRFDRVLNAVLSSQQAECDWDAADRAWNVLVNQLGDENTEVIVRHLLKSGHSLSTIGKWANELSASADAVLEHKDCKGTIPEQAIAGAFAGMNAYTIASAMKNPGVITNILRKIR